jgi:flagellar biogenesis protein FliO
METLQQTGAVLLVLILLGAAVYVLKRKNLTLFNRVPGFGGGERRLQVVERVSLGPHHTLCLVRVGERTVLVTTSPASCHIAEGFTP